MKLKIYVIGPITYGDRGKGISRIADFLRKKGFKNVFNPLEIPVDHTVDYRDRKEEAILLYRKDEEFIRNGIDLIVADLRGPSDGRTTEQIIGIKHGKPVIGYAPSPIYSPWSIVHTTKIVRNLEELVEFLKEYEKEYL